MISQEEELFVYPAKHFVLPEERIESAVASIREELELRLEELKNQGKLLEAQRLNARTRFDIEMLTEAGYCPGVENYSRPLSGRPPGSTPDTLFNYFPDDFLMFVDESHVTVPQVRGMFAGDYSRKSTLVSHGFRLPSALDNRPLKFEEWEQKAKQTIFVSATPGPYELQQTGGEVVEQVIRPTGLLDPVIEVSPARGQVQHLLAQIKERRAVQERVLVTTLTKRLAEDLSYYLVGARRSVANGCTASSTRSSAWNCCASCGPDASTPWSASTCCAKGSICPRFRWWRFSTRTKKAFCGARRR